MKKVLLVSYLHGYGGAERQIILLANALAQMGYNTTLVSLSANNPKYDIDKAVTYCYIKDKYKGKLNIIGRYLELKQKIKAVQPDVIITYWYQAVYLISFMSKTYFGKLIYSERGDPGDKEYSGLLGIIRKLTMNRVDAWVFQSKGAQSYFNRAIKCRSCIIHNPVYVSSRDFPYVTSREKRIVSVGRLHKQKNQSLLIEAFARIADQFPDYILEIYGDGELKLMLDEKIKKMSLTNRVYLRGACKEIHSKIYNASLFVLSSDFEGLPNALIEAMSLGLPCISTDCRPGGAREIITNQKDGIIVPTNDVVALSEAMKSLLSDVPKASKFGRNALVHSKEFEPETIFEQWRNLIES